MQDTDPWTVWTILALAGVTVLARGFFFISNRDWHLPTWAERGLQYAPIAALSAVVVPEIVLVQGQLVHTWRDARLFAVAAGIAWFYARRGKGQGVLGTILSGMAVYLPLHLGLGW